MREASSQELKHVFIVLFRAPWLARFRRFSHCIKGDSGYSLPLKRWRNLEYSQDQDDTPRNSHDDVREGVHVSSLVHPLYPKQITAQGVMSVMIP